MFRGNVSLSRRTCFFILPQIIILVIAGFSRTPYVLHSTTPSQRHGKEESREVVPTDLGLRDVVTDVMTDTKIIYMPCDCPCNTSAAETNDRTGTSATRAGGGVVGDLYAFYLRELRGSLSPSELSQLSTNSVHEQLLQLKDIRKQNKKSPRCKEVETTLDKPFDFDFVINLEKWPIGSTIKIPKVVSSSSQSASLDKCNFLKWRRIGEVSENITMKGVVPERDPIREVYSAPHERCAVVGNGGGTLFASFGKFIDAHDAVFRFNGGPTKGFEQHVGSRTTYRLDNTQHFLFGENGTDEIVLQHITTAKMLTRLEKKASNPEVETLISKYSNGTVRAHIIDPFFHYHVMGMHENGAPSNGFFGIVLAHHLCTQVTLFGFQKDWRGEMIPYHYYNEIEPNDGQQGRDDKEWQPYLELLQASNSIARKDPKWRQWKRSKGWRFAKFAYAEELVRFRGDTYG